MSGQQVAESESETTRAKRKLRAPSATVRENAEQAREAAAAPKQRTVFASFLLGLTWPVRMLWRGVVWLAHRPPLKTIGHGLRWFFTRRPVRFVGRILGLSYLASSFREVRLVTWPTRRQSFRLTGAVIIFSVVFGAIVAGADYGLGKIFKHIILK